MTSTFLSVALTAPELAALGRIMGLPDVLLPGDPFRGWLFEEIEETVSAAVLSLVSRQLLRLEGEKAWVEPDLAVLIGLLAFPQMTIRIAEEKDPASGDVSVVYVRAEAWAHLQQTVDGYELQGGEDFQELKRWITDRVSGRNPVSRRQPVFHIPERAVPVLQEAWKGTSMIGTCDALVERGVPQRAVEILEHLLPGEEIRSLMIDRRDGGQFKVAGGAFIVDHNEGMSMLLLDVRNVEAVWQGWSARAFNSWLIHILAQTLPGS